MDLTSIYGIATVIAVVTLCVTEALKSSFDIKPKNIPLLSIFIGVILGIAAAPLHEATIVELAWGGGLSGLIASGAFSAAKRTLAKQEEEEQNETTNKRDENR